MGGHIGNSGGPYREAFVVRLGEDNSSSVGPATLPPGLAITTSPNPFVGSVRVQFTLNEKSKPEIGIYDVEGRLVQSIPTAMLHPARHSFEWDGKDRDGVRVPPGVYFCRIRAGVKEVTGKMVLAR
jgi:flagellar hook assembly protein FlgD